MKATTIDEAVDDELRRANKRAARLREHEDAEQIRFVSWVRSRCLLVWHTRNANEPKNWSYWKAMGVLRGFPDVCVIMPNGTHLALEFKSSTGRTTPAQESVLGALVIAGWRTAVVRSCAEAREFVEKII